MTQKTKKKHWKKKNKKKRINAEQKLQPNIQSKSNIKRHDEGTVNYIYSAKERRSMMGEYMRLRMDLPLGTSFVALPFPLFYCSSYHTSLVASLSPSSAADPDGLAQPRPDPTPWHNLEYAVRNSPWSCSALELRDALPDDLAMGKIFRRTTKKIENTIRHIGVKRKE